MGRDVAYTPFTWQTQTAAQNRFLKFLLVVIVLCAATFYIGYPDSKQETPKPDSHEYHENNPSPVISANPFSETKPDSDDFQKASQDALVISPEAQSSIESPVFNNSVLPSGPDDESYKEKLAKLEEEERKITEKLDSEKVEDQNSGVEEVTELPSTQKTNEEELIEEETTKAPEDSTATVDEVNIQIEETSEAPEESEQPGKDSEDLVETTTPGTFEVNAKVDEGFVTIEENKENLANDNSERPVESLMFANSTETASGSTVTAESSTEVSSSSEFLISTQEPMVVVDKSSCHVEEWNNVTLDEVPHKSVFKQWIANKNVELNETDFIGEEKPTILGAFAYKNYIAVTLSARNFSTLVLGVYCGRSKVFNRRPTADPADGPPTELEHLRVNMPESVYVRIIETVFCRYFDCKKKEMVRQMKSFVFPESTVYCPRRAGANYISISSTFFHVYLKNTSHYQRVLLDDYIRSGDIRVVKVAEDVSDQVQANDCLHRSRYLSKWTAFLNLEDRLEAKQDKETIAAYLDSIVDHKTNILKWSSPENADVTRLLVRPERIVSINDHPITVYLGDELDESLEPSGILRKFSTSSNLSPENFTDNLNEDVQFREELIANIPNIALEDDVYNIQYQSIRYPEACFSVDFDHVLESGAQLSKTLFIKMKKIQRYKFVLISLVIVFVIVYFYQPGSGYFESVDELFSIVAGEPINASFPIAFYQSAYVDYRFDPPRLRIYTLNKCVKNNHFLLADLHLNGNSSESVRKNIYGKSMDGHCPSIYIPASSCFYTPHTFSIGLKPNEDPKKVAISLGSKTVELNIEKIYKKTTEGITVCLQPVYYYSQWQNIVLYIEAWRAQGATRFIVYFHSATKETWKVLEYYRDLGLIEIKSWPSFPSLPVDIAGKYPKIDNSVYVLSYFMAMNICILDIKTTIGTIADFDEVMVPSNGRLLDYATKEMTGTSVGALSFENNYLTLTPKIYTSNFSGVASPKFQTTAKHTKYVFNASVLAIAQVHWPHSFVDSFFSWTRSKKADGALLHFRYSPRYGDLETTEKSFRFFPGDQSTHIQNMRDTVQQIFNGSIPTFSSKYYDALQKCLSKVDPVQDKVCRSTSGICREEMDKVTDWVYDNSEPIFLVGT
ncbi:Protein CBG11351 [Caenorhabditis briggsae]|uniref:Protein CBG11351 n=1 Tax=Caenorhabditis briggsae TaxID=6238 RepID=A8XD79_CAEBR|nr:Protein CBG11351 [Caenorhabditis briggsae]CAP30598.1 Protein CBG11351 [Caenorhabditis briggsae]